MGNQSRISHQGETWPDLSLEITGCSWKNGLEEAVGCREMNIFQENYFSLMGLYGTNGISLLIFQIIA